MTNSPENNRNKRKIGILIKDTIINIKYELIIFFISLAFLFLLILLHPRMIGIDEFIHFMIVKSVTFDPIALYSPWGKVGFTLISFLVMEITKSYYSFLPIRIMNAIIVSITCSVVYHIGRMKKYEKKWIFLGIFTLLTATEYLQTSTAAYTEISFSFLLVISYFAYIKKRYMLQSLILSLAFLFRPEAVIFMGIFALYMLKEKRFKEIILLAVFPAIWCFFLLTAHKNPMIILEYYPVVDQIQMPFKLTIYPFIGQGFKSAIYYFVEMPNIFGWVGLFFFIIGVINKTRKKENLFILFNFCALFLFETIIIIVPGFGSSGLTRYFYCILPLCSFYFIDGISEINNFLSKLLKNLKRKIKLRRILKKRGHNSLENKRKIVHIKNKFVYIYFTVILSILLIYGSISTYQFVKVQYPTTDDYELQESAGEFLINNYDMKNTTVYYPIFGISNLMNYFYEAYMYLDENLFNESSSQILENYTIVHVNGYFVGNVETMNLTTISKGDLVVWHNQFYENSYFNPKNIDLTKFQIIYSNTIGNYSLYIYKKL